MSQSEHGSAYSKEIEFGARSVGIMPRANANAWIGGRATHGDESTQE